MQSRSLEHVNVFVSAPLLLSRDLEAARTGRKELNDGRIETGIRSKSAAARFKCFFLISRASKCSASASFAFSTRSRGHSDDVATSHLISFPLFVIHFRTIQRLPKRHQCNLWRAICALNASTNLNDDGAQIAFSF